MGGKSNLAIEQPASRNLRKRLIASLPDLTCLSFPPSLHALLPPLFSCLSPAAVSVFSAQSWQ